MQDSDKKKQDAAAKEQAMEAARQLFKQVPVKQIKSKDDLNEFFDKD
ncbi:MAG: hypothetical protein LKF01_01275 [Lactobacillus sp.]|jgi:hypothetical protein|nr:hypothetical protein [Lactobacillus sp.]MCH4068169.1 hypothetical protein [Lactobacillus sp.]MCI1304350.1 hypothetical protein [Lactobacillus sp.]MCI1330100.1 hypothetical protein [Lactobacillus sp.]MCI1360015.1 hypothetical protein [Lactobacillus sp.]